MHKYPYLTNPLSFSNKVVRVHALSTVGPSVTALARMQEHERNVGCQVLRVQRLVNDGSSICADRTFGPRRMYSVSAEATLEAQLHRRHRPRNRPAADNIQRQPKERAVTEKPEDERPLHPERLKRINEVHIATHKHTQREENLATRFEADIRKGIFAHAWEHGFVVAEAVQPQASVVDGSLPAFRHEGCANQPQAHDGACPT